MLEPVPRRILEECFVQETEAWVQKGERSFEICADSFVEVEIGRVHCDLKHV
jgi:hypothetical protein